MSSGLNPYSPPTAPPKLIKPPKPAQHSGVLRGLCWLQVAVVIIGLAAEYFHIETIVISGAILFLAGFTMAVIGFRRRKTDAALHGVLAAAFALFVFGLINILHWSPSEADRPVKMMSIGFAVVALPTAIWIARRPDDPVDTLDNGETLAP